MKKLKEFSVINKRVLVRCDLNVPLNKDGEILDDFRIKQTLPTIKYLIDNICLLIENSKFYERYTHDIPNIYRDVMYFSNIKLFFNNFFS